MTFAEAEPTPAELQSISDACAKLWELDENRLEPGQDYVMNLQQGKRIFDKQDMADEKLFTGVSKSVWEKRTYLIFYHLLDNYERSTGVQEKTSQREHKEQWDFLNACMQTAPMQYCFRYLVAKGLCENSEEAFVKMIHQAWFAYYRRDEQNDSCGFEHVFVGEIDDGHVKGLHNWIQTMVEESRGELDYKGFVLPRRHNQYQEDEDDMDGPRRVVSIQLGWEGEIKDVSTMFVGTSPEFELALYSLCFFAGEEVNRVTVGDYDLDIKCYRIKSKYGDKVSSCFPVALE